MTPISIPLNVIEPATASALVVSLPMPPWPAHLAVPGADTVQVVPLGQWPAQSLVDPKLMAAWDGTPVAQPLPFGNPPRRCLVHARFPEGVPAAPRIEVTPGTPLVATPPLSATIVAEPGDEVYHHRDEALYHYVRREDSAVLTLAGHRVRLRLGMLVNGQRRYWQWVGTIPAWDGPLTAAATIGGHIYAGPDEDRPMTIDEAKRVDQLSYFEECTVSAKAFIVLHGDGALEVSAHFANVQGYGRGHLASGLPFIELAVPDGFPAGSWPLVDEGETSTAEPGLWRWQPLASTRIWLGNRWPGGMVLASGQPVPHHVRDSEKGLVPGVGRTFRFTWAVPGSQPLPVRALASPDWYGRCGLAGTTHVVTSLDGHDDLNRLQRQAVNVFKRNWHPDGMSRGGIYRYLDQQPDGRYELSLDGNEAAFILRAACLLGDGDLYRLGMEAARAVADIGVDHNDFNVHYHGDNDEWSLYSLIYDRFAGLVTAWQETGDPWYLEQAEAVANRWIAVNRQNQPRQNMGRDAEPIEGLMMLFEATGKDHYFQEAEKIALDVGRSLYADGTWRSGFGVGPYWGTNALHGTAWNGSHLLAGIVEFLLRANPATSPYYACLLAQAVALVNGICRSIDDDFGGFHRASGSFLWRRFALVAELAGDERLRERLRQVATRTLATFSNDPEAFFTTGHHCAGYLDGPFVWAAVFPRQP